MTTPTTQARVEGTVDPVVLHVVECRVCGTWTQLDCLPLAEAERMAEFMRLGAVHRDDVRVVPLQNAGSEGLT